MVYRFDVQYHCWRVYALAVAAEGAGYRWKGGGGDGGEEEVAEVGASFPESVREGWRTGLTDEDRERTATNIQLISDLCDLTVPSTALGYANLDDGIVGLAGTVSSLIGVWTTWKKTA